MGETAGGEPNHYGEVKRFELPNSGIPIRYSTKYFHWREDGANRLEPDVEVAETFADYQSGQDPVQEWIFEREGEIGLNVQ